jgi:hypothetical protein
MNPLVVSVIALVVSIFTLILTWWRARSNARQVTVAVRQAINAETQTRLQRTNLLVQIEGRINDARLAVEEACHSMSVSNGSGNQDELSDRSRLYESRKEHYLNQLERLAAETNKNNLDLADMHREYRDTIRSVLRQYPDKFGPGTGFREIVKLNARFEAALDAIPSAISKVRQE